MTSKELEPAADDEPVIWVRRQWNDYRDAKYRLSEVSNLHWTDTSGGVRARAPRDFIHGYVSCDGMLEGELAHSCAHGSGPHYIKVCIVKKANSKQAYALAEQACRENEERRRRRREEERQRHLETLELERRRRGRA